VHWYRNAFSKAPQTKIAEVDLMLKAIHASESRAAAEMTAERVRATLEDMISKLGEWITATVGETLTYHPRHALAQDTNEQRLRTAASRNPAPHARSGSVP